MPSEALTTATAIADWLSPRVCKEEGLTAPYARRWDIDPATLLLSVGSVSVPGLVNDVVLLAETGTTDGLPSDSAEAREVVTQQVTDALPKSLVMIHSPGRFAPPGT